MKKTNNGCTCPLTGLPVNTILLAIILIGGAVLGTSLYSKINDIHKANIGLQFGSSKNFEKMLEVNTSPEVQKQIEEEINKRVEFIKNMAEQETTTDVDTPESTSSDDGNTPEAISTKAALRDPKWTANSTEAETNFGLQGTPGNAVINVKDGTFQAVGGAYPQDTFEAVVAAIKNGDSLNEFSAIGQSGKLDKATLEKVLSNVHYYGNKDADIVIVEYSDILCPFCQRHYNNRTLENIADADTSVAVVFKNMPIASLHPTAPLAAKGIECAGEIGGTEAFYKYLDEAFTYQTFNGSNVVKIAESVGLDKDAFVACFTK